MLENNAPKQIQICFNDAFAIWPVERQGTTRTALSSVLGVGLDCISSQRVCGDNIGYDLSVSSAEAENLHCLLQENSGQLRLLGIENIILERAAGDIEMWMVVTGRFKLVKTVPPILPSEAGQVISGFEAVPRIWLFHLVYLLVTVALAISILRFSTLVSFSLLLISFAAGVGVLLARTHRLVAAHILAVAIGLGAPIVVCARLWPNQTVILFIFLVSGIFMARRSLF